MTTTSSRAAAPGAIRARGARRIHHRAAGTPWRPAPVWTAKAGVLLGIALPAGAFAAQSLPPSDAAPLAQPAGPSVLEVLAAQTPQPTISALVAAGPRRYPASRSADRNADSQEVLAGGCSGIVTDPGTNGRVPASQLCDLWQRPFRDRADAVVALWALNDLYTVQFGEPMCLSSGYRTFEEQAALKRDKPGLAAPAGMSNHGWGLAVDLCPQTYAGTRAKWLETNGRTYGWENPDWAKKGGAGAYEPWHWEYFPGVLALEEGRAP